MLGFDALGRLPLNSLPDDTGQTLFPTLYADADAFYSATLSPGPVTLTPALYSDPDTFYAPQINLAVYPAAFSDGDTFYTPKLTTTVYPAAFADPDTFYSATVLPGTLTLSPSLFVDADAFYSLEIGLHIAPDLYIDADIFYPPHVGLGTPQIAYPYANISMRSGFKRSPDYLVREWTGLVVALDECDPRHPQELVRPTSDRQRVPVPRPERADVFLATNEVTAADL